MNCKELSGEIRVYIVNTFTSNDEKRFPYHNLEHTESVVANSWELTRQGAGRAIRINSKEKEYQTKHSFQFILEEYF
jgi:hypothetical protein